MWTGCFALRLSEGNATSDIYDDTEAGFKFS
jgi:hypothetical protein